jgi:hypothetical protein
VALDRDSAFMQINYHLKLAAEYESNITYWSIVMAALHEEKPLFEGDIEAFRGQEKKIRRRIRRNERAMVKQHRKADKVIRRYTRAGGDIHG